MYCPSGRNYQGRHEQRMIFHAWLKGIVQPLLCDRFFSSWINFSPCPDLAFDRHPYYTVQELQHSVSFTTGTWYFPVSSTAQSCNPAYQIQCWVNISLAYIMKNSCIIHIVELWVTVVAQWSKAPGIHCYVAGSIPAVIPRYCTKKIEKCPLWSTKKQKQRIVTPHIIYNRKSRPSIEYIAMSSLHNVHSGEPLDRVKYHFWRIIKDSPCL